VAFDADPTSDGPRVAAPDHEPGWETALRLPFRIVFFPLRLLATGLGAAADYVGPRYLEPKPNTPPKRGWSLRPNVTLGGFDDVGLGPAIVYTGFPTADAKLRLTGSWSTIDRRRARFSGLVGDGRPVGFRLSADYDYKPNRRYYGIGNETPETDVSHYLLESTDAEAALLLGRSPLRQLRIVAGFSNMSPRRGYGGQPLLEDVFSPTSAPFEHQATQELSFGVTGDLAALDRVRDPSLGAHGLFDLRRAGGVRSGDPDYYQWRAEGRAYVPVFAKRRVIALRGVYTGIDPTGGTTVLPFYRLAQSRGFQRFAGFSSERFRDRQLMLARIEYRWEILDRLSAVALYELGAVAPDRQSFKLRDTHRSYGGGLRVGIGDASALRVEVGKSVEGPHAVLRMGNF
jgi:outer membrane protein assembly factor BamA